MSIYLLSYICDEKCHVPCFFPGKGLFLAPTAGAIYTIYSALFHNVTAFTLSRSGLHTQSSYFPPHFLMDLGC